MSFFHSGNKEIPAEVFDTVGYQNVMLSMWMLRNFIVSVAVKTNRLDPEKLLKAVNIEIERNEGLRCRMRKNGNKWQQYFTEPFRLDSIQTTDMRNAAVSEVEAAVDKASNRKLKLRKKGPTFFFHHFVGPDDKDYLLFNILHVYSDGFAASLTLTDTLQVYFALCGLREMPQPLTSVREFLPGYQKYLEARAKRVETDKDYFIRQFEQYGEPQYLPARKNAFDFSKGKAVAPVPKLYKKVLMYRTNVPDDFLQLMNAFREKQRISFNGLLLTAFSIYYAAINDGRNDISFNVNLDFRAKKAEKKVPFFLAGGVFFRNILDLDATFEKTVTETDAEYTSVLRYNAFDSVPHGDYCVEHYGTKTGYNYFDIIYSYMSMDDKCPDGWSMEGIWPCPEKVMDNLMIYLLVLESSGNNLSFSYRYQIDVYNEEDIRNLHNGMVRILTRGMENPALSVKELMEEFM